MEDDTGIDVNWTAEHEDSLYENNVKFKLTQGN